MSNNDKRGYFSAHEDYNKMQQRIYASGYCNDPEVYAMQTKSRHI